MTDDTPYGPTPSQQGPPDDGPRTIDHDHDSHGKSVAAWTSVCVVMFGSLLMSIAVLISSVALFVVGTLVVVAGAVAAKVLSAMGFGTGGPPHQLPDTGTR